MITTNHKATQNLQISKYHIHWIPVHIPDIVWSKTMWCALQVVFGAVEHWKTIHSKSGSSWNVYTVNTVNAVHKVNTGNTVTMVNTVRMDNRVNTDLNCEIFWDSSIQHYKYLTGSTCYIFQDALWPVSQSQKKIKLSRQHNFSCKITVFRLSRQVMDYLDCPDSFWIVRTVFGLSGWFLDCPDSFWITWTVFELSR